ncbi:MAG: phosphonate C-P lyase system protein PhnH [Devosia sp.]
MQPTLTLPPEDARAAATFDALMWALSEPGRFRDLPEPGFFPLAAALIDRECTFHAGDEALAARILGLGGIAAPLEMAEFVFTSLDDADTLPARLYPGDAIYPDTSATLIAPATFGAGTRLALTGPGIRTRHEVEIAGIEPAFWFARAATLRYPLGFDIFLVDGVRVIGLPRTTEIEVL